MDYDEDLTENKWYNTLCEKHQDLFLRATNERWMVRAFQFISAETIMILQQILFIFITENLICKITGGSLYLHTLIRTKSFVN